MPDFPLPPVRRKESVIETFTPVAASKRGDTPISKFVQGEGETKELDSVSQWKPPVMNGRALIVNGHSSLGNDDVAISPILYACIYTEYGGSTNTVTNFCKSTTLYQCLLFCCRVGQQTDH